jgi:hypothetical protein
MNYTHRSERHPLALLKRSYQAVYYSLFHKTIFFGTFWRGFGRVGAVMFNTRGLVCGGVHGAWKLH